MPKIFLLLYHPFLNLFGCREQAFVEDFLGSVPAGNSSLEIHVEPSLQYIKAIMKPGGPATVLFLQLRALGICLLLSAFQNLFRVFVVLHPWVFSF